MKKNRISQLLLACLLAFGLVSCRDAVKPNQSLILIHAVGDAEKRVELIRGGKVWIGPTDKSYWFEEGLQSYHFCGRSSFESPDNEAFTFNCIGGTVTFDVMIQLRLRTEEDAAKFRDELWKLIQDYQLSKYQGQTGILGKLVHDRFKIVIQDRLNAECRSRNTAQVFEEKAAINAALQKALREKFAPYGIEIISAGITSAVTLPAAQQEKMNQLVIDGFRLQALSKREQEVTPKVAEIQTATLMGEVEAQKARDTAIGESIRVTAEVEAYRQGEFKKLLGDNALDFETMRTMVTGLEGGKTIIRIVPEKATIWINPNQPQTKTK